MLYMACWKRFHTIPCSAVRKHLDFFENHVFDVQGLFRYCQSHNRSSLYPFSIFVLSCLTFIFPSWNGAISHTFSFLPLITQVFSQHGFGAGLEVIIRAVIHVTSNRRKRECECNWVRSRLLCSCSCHGVMSCALECLFFFMDVCKSVNLCASLLTCLMLWL